MRRGRAIFRGIVAPKGSPARLSAILYGVLDTEYSSDRWSSACRAMKIAYWASVTSLMLLILPDLEFSDDSYGWGQLRRLPVEEYSLVPKVRCRSVRVSPCARTAALIVKLRSIRGRAKTKTTSFTGMPLAASTA